MSIDVFRLPDLGEGLTEADILRWLVAEGETVTMDQPIVEVETAKSAVEIPSPYAGVVHQLHGAEGDTVTVGQPLIEISDGAETPPAAQRPAPSGEATREDSPEPSTAAPYREEERAGTEPSARESEPDSAEETSGNVLIGYGTTSTGSSRRRRRGTRAQRVPDATPPVSAADSSGARDQGARSPQRLAPTVISPLVRRLAKDHGVELASIHGTGPGGLIMRQDVLSAVDQASDQRRRSDASAPAPPTLARVSASSPGADITSPGPATDHADDGLEVDTRTGLGIIVNEPVKGARKAISEAMSRSRTEIPEATVWVEADATELLNMRASYKAKNPETAPSLLALLARFTLAGLRAYPQLCSRIETHDDGTQSITRFAGVNLGLAVEAERGLLVPNLPNAHRLSTLELNQRIRDVVDLARSGQASPAQLSGSTFTLNNYGVFGTDGATPIINHPEVGILGIGRMIDKPWVVDGELAVRKITTLTLAFDHRVCDGGAAGGFLRFVADAVEDPHSAFLHM